MNIWIFLFTRRNKLHNEHDKEIDDISTIHSSWNKFKYMNTLKKVLKKRDLLNKNQCTNLYLNIKDVMKIFDHLMNCKNDGLECGNLISEFLHVLKKAYLQIKQCREKN